MQQKANSESYITSNIAKSSTPYESNLQTSLLFLFKQKEKCTFAKPAFKTFTLLQ